MEKLDSTLEATLQLKELGDVHSNHVKSMVHHHTVERILSGTIEDRISYKELTQKLNKELKKEGINGSVEFAVYNDDKKDYEDGYMSKGFDKKQEK